MKILRVIGKELGIVIRKLNNKSIEGMEEVEKIINSETPFEYVTRVAMNKAIFSSQRLLKISREINPILCGDTIVCLGNKIFLKPHSTSDVIKMLSELSNKEHKVITSIVLALPNFEKNCSFEFHQINNVTSVLFSKIPDVWIKNYSKTDEPIDKSGSYAIQGRASIFIKKISGSYSSVVGLPIHETHQLLLEKLENHSPLI